MKSNIVFALTALAAAAFAASPDAAAVRRAREQLLRFTAKKMEGELNSVDIASLRKATFQEEYSGKTIAEKYQQEAYRCWDRAYRFLTMFKGIDENTYL